MKLTIESAKTSLPLDLTRYALGQGGLSDKPMFDAHVDQIARLHPQTIRIFVQEYFNLYPARGRYHWDTLDKTIETVRATGAKPILCLCFKPSRLFPKIDQRIVHPTDYQEWEELVFQLVWHCNREKRYGIEYWEVANEPDIGEDGGCPYLFQPQDYVTYYAHTARAILRADAKAKVGGPALAGYQSAIADALIEHCGNGETPLHFLSWHVYSSEPEFFRKTIREMKAKLAKFPRLKETETILDEWNMSLDKPNLNPAFQPAFVLETTRVFYEEGLSRSAYYHIRDYFVREEQFAPFMSKPGAAFMARWWNDMPQLDGLYDHQGQVRPAYYAFKLLSLLHGQQLRVDGTSPDIKALAAKNGRVTNVVIWNFPSGDKSETHQVTLHFPAIQSGRFRVARLNPESHLNQLELQRSGKVSELKSNPLCVKLPPFEIVWVAIQE